MRQRAAYAVAVASDRVAMAAEDGTGAPCPACPMWFAEVDGTWRDHVAGEHPVVFARLRQASTDLPILARSERRRTRLAISHDLDQAAALRAQLRDRAAAAM